jgi:hypothetical protein
MVIHKFNLNGTGPLVLRLLLDLIVSANRYLYESLLLQLLGLRALETSGRT